MLAQKVEEDLARRAGLESQSCHRGGVDRVRELDVIQVYCRGGQYLLAAPLGSLQGFGSIDCRYALQGQGDERRQRRCVGQGGVAS